MSEIGMTSTSKLKSMDTISERENHSGKKNRGKFKHANEKIDPKLSEYNVEFDFYVLRELQHKHYDEKIERHNRNNNSESRRWGSRDGTIEEQKESALDDFLATFEGKKMKSKGKVTKNERWSTVGQISYFGSRHTLNPMLEAIEAAGATMDEIMDRYSKAYKNYVLVHNEHFPTLPIYASDIHFDETTPHGHDHMLAMGHTKKGNPSDSIDNALGEKYGYPSNFEERTENFKKYRADNDKIIYCAMLIEFEELANAYGLDIDFDFIRTGAKGGLSIEEYKRQEDLKAKENEILLIEEDLTVKINSQKNLSDELDIRKVELDEKEESIEYENINIQSDLKFIMEAHERIEKDERELEEQKKQLDEQRKELEKERYENKKLKAETEDLQFVKDFKGAILEYTPKVATLSELNSKMLSATDGDFRVMRNKKDGKFVYADVRGDKPKATNLKTIVESVYNMDGSDFYLEEAYGPTQELSFVVGHMKYDKIPLSDNNASNTGFEIVTNAVTERQKEFEKERSL